MIWPANATGSRALWIYKDGTDPVAIVQDPVSSADDSTAQEISTQIQLDAGHYVQLLAGQDSTTTLTIAGATIGSPSPVFTVHWIGPGT